MKDEALKLALEALESGDGWRQSDAITAIKQALAAPVQEPVKLRRGDVLWCIETDELCTVWATSTTHKTLVKWGGNDFSDYTAEQIGELFWLEPESSDVEIAAEQSDNYAAFHAGVRFARAHSIAAQRPAADLVECGNCHEGMSDMDHVCKKCLGAGWIRNPNTTPPAAIKQDLTTAPAAQRQWVGLTDEEANELWEGTDDRDSWELIMRVQAKLKEKNT
jgi:hypothetical protein